MRLVVFTIHVIGICFFLSSAASGQVGSVGSVRETGGPMRDLSQSVSDSTGPVRESTSFPAAERGGPLGGIPVSAGSRSVYGSGCVSDGSSGSVADVTRGPLSLPVVFEIPFLAHSTETLGVLEETVRGIQPSEREETVKAENDLRDTEFAAHEPALRSDRNQQWLHDSGPPLQPMDEELTLGHAKADEAGAEHTQAVPSRPDESELLLSGEPTE